MPRPRQVTPISSGTKAFTDAVSGGGRYLWAVGESGELRIIQEVGNTIEYIVLFAGADTQGAGNAEFEDGIVNIIDDESGHYVPFLEDVAPPSFLNSSVNAFRAAGVVVREEGITSMERF